MKLVATWRSQWLVLCAAWSAPVAWKIRHDSGNNLSQALEEESSCQTHICGRGWAPKPDHHKRKGSSDAACCDKTCALWTCTNGYAANAAYARNVYQSNDMCCDETCAHVDCKKGYKSRGASVHSISEDECCEITCELFSCPGNWSQKPGPVRVGHDQDTCCAPHCALFNCEALGWEPNLAALRRIGNSKAECCKKTCTSWTCPAGYAVPESKLHIELPNDDRCCEQKYCSAFKCGTGWKRNDTAKDDIGRSNEECCIATCSVYECDASAGWANSPSKSHLLGDDAQTCCEPACSNHTCTNAGWVPNKLVQSKPGQTDAVCCLKSCHLHECRESIGWKTKADAAALPADSDATCCLATCKRFSCSAGWVPNQEVSDKVGKSEDECCLKTCEKFACDASNGWLQDPEAVHKVGNNESFCCKPSCSKHSCSAGWVTDQSKLSSPGDTDEECCQKTCRMHSCGAAGKKRVTMWHKEAKGMAPSGFDGRPVNSAVLDEGSITDCQTFCAADPNLLGMGFAGKSCSCYTADLSIPLYATASKIEGDAYIESWQSPQDGFQGFSKVISDDYTCNDDVANLALNKNVSSNSWSAKSTKEGKISHPTLAVDGKSDRLLSKGWVSACNLKKAQVCSSGEAEGCQEDLHDWQPEEDKPYLEIDMGRLVKVNHLKATNFEDLDSRTREWSLQSSLTGKTFRKILHGNATSHATWDEAIPAGSVGRYFRFVLEMPRGGKMCQGLIELELHGHDNCVSKNGPALVKKPDIDDVPGNTDETCCEPADCQAWPRKLIEAKDGCERVPINDDCNGMYEKSRLPDGSNAFRRCAYSYAAGQVFGCGSLDKSQLTCSR